MRDQPVVLIVDANDYSFASISRALQPEGYATLSAVSGKAALEQLGANPVDAVLAAFMLPDMLGSRICQLARTDDRACIVYSRTDVDVGDRVKARRAGADAFVVLGSLPELVAVVDAVLRRVRPSPSPARLALGDLTLDIDARWASRSGDAIALTGIEWRILECLAQPPCKTVPTETIIAHVWGVDAYVDSSGLRPHISNVRAKIEPDRHNPRYIVTEPKVGFRLVVDAVRA